MFTQPAPSPPTLATSTSPVSPASPQRPSRLRGLSYLRNYTHNHLHSRDNNNSSEGSGSPRRYTLTRATSYPSPSLTPPGNRQGGPASPISQSISQRALPSFQRSEAERDGSDSQDNLGLTSGWLPTVGGHSGVSRIATQPQPTNTESSSGLISGNENPDDNPLSTVMGRARSATNGRVPGSDSSQVNGGGEQSHSGAASVQPGHGGNGVENGHQLPSIRFSQHQDVRAPRPSLVFSPMGRTLPTGKETIRVGRYSERENQPNPASNMPSAAPIGFKSKVVSRRHCEFWYQDGLWYIKDVKSSSGTFLNHVRLSSPGTESRPFPVKDGDIVQLGIDFKGGEEMIFRCVKIRIELNRGWQSALNSFNVASHKRLRNMAKQNMSPTSASSSQDCTICLGAVAPCQSLFVAPCSHTWHYKCVRRIINGPMWPQFICPNCRAVADLEADVDDPFPDAEWEEVDAADALEEQQTGVATLIPDTAPRLPTPTIERSNANGEHSSEDPHESSNEAPADDTTGSESELQHAMKYLNVSSRDQPATSLPSHSSVGPVNIRSGRHATRQEATSSTRGTGSDVGSFIRNDRTPSPSGNILAGPDGPMTPRNDAGPFVFDGSAGREGGPQVSTLNLTAMVETPPSGS